MKSPTTELDGRFNDDPAGDRVWWGVSRSSTQQTLDRIVDIASSSKKDAPNARPLIITLF